MQLDARIGIPFVWYFYGMHGNLVKRGQMRRSPNAPVRCTNPASAGYFMSTVNAARCA
jgi:hypothetical protein